MTDLTSLTLAEARDALAKKTITSAELTDAHLAAMEKARVLNAYVLETPEQARAMAKDADAKLAKGDGGPLGGIPLLKGMADPIPYVHFCPTGGIDIKKAPAYLALPNVACVGGSWVVPKDAVAAHDVARIEALAREAAALRPAA